MTSVISSLRRILLSWPSPPDATRRSQTAADGSPDRKQMFYRHAVSPHYARPASPTSGTSPSGSDYVIFCRLYLQSSQELHRLQSGQMIVPDSTDIGLARHAVAPSYVERTTYILYVDDD